LNTYKNIIFLQLLLAVVLLYLHSQEPFSSTQVIKRTNQAGSSTNQGDQGEEEEEEEEEFDHNEMKPSSPMLGPTKTRDTRDINSNNDTTTNNIGSNGENGTTNSLSANPTRIVVEPMIEFQVINHDDGYLFDKLQPPNGVLFWGLFFGFVIALGGDVSFIFSNKVMMSEVTWCTLPLSLSLIVCLYMCVFFFSV
jgi:hypothetical protein